MKESVVSLATVRAISENKETISILRVFNTVSEPLRLSEVAQISGVPYETVYSQVFRLVDCGLISIQHTVFNKRLIYVSVASAQGIQEVLDYYEKQKVREAGRYASGKLSTESEEV